MKHIVRQLIVPVAAILLCALTVPVLGQAAAKPAATEKNAAKPAAVPADQSAPAAKPAAPAAPEVIKKGKEEAAPAADAKDAKKEETK